ncbi:MAG: N-acetylmuramoyl-L-alanine amidase [Bacillota bacterium]
MKRVTALLLVIVLILSSNITVFAVKKDNGAIQLMDNKAQKKISAVAVNLMVAGEDVVSDVPTVLVNNRTLVPIRYVVENMGIQAEIEWNQSTYEATIRTEDKTIVLKIDSDTAVVNGKTMKLPDGVPAKLLGYNGNDRTMVPLRFVSEQLGMDVFWNGQTQTAIVDLPKQEITGISFDASGLTPKIEIHTTGQINMIPTYVQYNNTNKLVIDIPNALLNVTDPTIIESTGTVKKSIGEKGITAVRAARFEADPRDVSRIVVDLESKKDYNVVFNAEQNKIEIQFLNNVKKIDVEQINSVEAVVIQTDEEPVYNVISLGNRVVVDILNAQLQTSQREIPVSRGGVKQIRTAPFAPDNNYNENDKIVRVVLDLEDWMKAEDIFIESDGNNVLAYFSGSPLKGIAYEKQKFNQSYLQLSLTEQGNYFSDYNRDSRELTVVVEKEKSELRETAWNVMDNVVESIKIDDSRDSEYNYITMKLAKGTEYTEQNKNNLATAFGFLFINKSMEQSKFVGQKIVIDPGHGDKDPGAISTNLKLKEKDLNLDVSKRLAKLLENAGFTVVMTRKDDTFVDLYGRSDIANNLGADAFVSVHFNALPTKTDMNGIEMLYNGSDPQKDSENFARVMLQEVVKELKATDRGIIERPNLVVIRETKMPAVLAEMGYLTNSYEESLISTDEYRQKCAQALFNGITRYFEEVILK